MEEQRIFKYKIDKISSFIKPYMWIIEAYVSDYFRLHFKERLPSQWIDVLSQCSPNELASLLSLDTWNTKHCWPLSLLAFRTTVHSLALDRKPVDFEDDINQNTVNGQVMALEHCYRRHVKPKKQHEILRMAKILHSSFDPTDHIVDLGAGHGHLARLLAYGYQLKVTTIEAADLHAPKAAKFDREVKKDIEVGKIGRRKRKHASKQENNTSEPATINPDEIHHPVHVVARINPDCSVNEFLDKLNTNSCSLSEYSKCNSGSDDFMQETGLTQGVVAKKEENEMFMNIDKMDAIKRKNMNKEEQCNVKNTYENSVQNNGDKMEIVKSESYPNVCENNSLILNTNNCNVENESCDKRTKLNNDICSHVSSITGIKETNAEKSERSDNSKATTTHPVRIDTRCQKEKNINTRDNHYVLTGLHACGDLSATMLHVFLQCKEVVGLANVGCCYMKMEQNCDKYPGYPMSDFVRSLPHATLSYEAKEMACHFIDTYHKRLLDSCPHLISHCYRAALQEIIYEKNPNILHGQVRLTTKKVAEMSFEQYASKALPRLGLCGELNDSQKERANIRLTKWKEVVAFYTIRLALAPLVEALILLDRQLFLAEHDVSSRLLPIFDPSLSPRNFILFAKKDTR